MEKATREMIEVLIRMKEARRNWAYNYTMNVAVQVEAQLLDTEIEDLKAMRECDLHNGTWVCQGKEDHS